MPRYHFVDVYEFSYIIEADDEAHARGLAAEYDSTNADVLQDETYVETRLVLIESFLPAPPPEEKGSYGPDLP